MTLRSIALAVSAAAALAQSLTLQPCLTGFAAEHLAVQADGTVRDAADALCVTDDGAGGLGMAACIAPTSKTQVFTFNADGTVASASSAGQCWNAYGGSTSPGTGVALYACGVVKALAANDVFYPIPSWGTSKEPRVFANESQLCVSWASAPPPPPPNGSCTTDFDCTLNGKCTGGQCACYKPWTAAPDCSRLAFLPSPLQRGYPTPGHNETTWGKYAAHTPPTRPPTRPHSRH
jgi:hypothetical protein